MSEAVVFAAATAGFALAPDLDHPGATASRFLGPVTGGLSRVLRAASSALYRWTKGPADENHKGKHRHLTHTAVFALVLGVATAVGTAVGGRWAVLAVLAVGVLLAENALGDWVPVAAVGAGGFVVVQDGAFAALDAASGWLGVAVALGCLVHSCGDALTESGCPILWPVPIRGETWYELRSPSFLRFRTGKWQEQLVVFPAFAVLGVLLLPGVWGVAAEAVVRTAGG